MGPMRGSVPDGDAGVGGDIDAESEEESEMEPARRRPPPMGIGRERGMSSLRLEDMGDEHELAKESGSSAGRKSRKERSGRGRTRGAYNALGTSSAYRTLTAPILLGVTPSTSGVGRRRPPEFSSPLGTLPSPERAPVSCARCPLLPARRLCSGDRCPPARPSTTQCSSSPRLGRVRPSVSHVQRRPRSGISAAPGIEIRRSCLPTLQALCLPRDSS